VCVCLSLPLCRRICGVHNWREPHHGVLIIERGRSAQSHVVRCKCLRSPWDQRVARRDQALPCGIQSTGLPGRCRCGHAHHLLVLQVRSRSTQSSRAMRNGLLVVVLLLKLAKQASKVLVRFLLPSSALSDSFVCLLFLSFFSTKNSSTFNLVMTVLHIAFVLFIIVAGFAKGDVRNLTIAAASAGGAAATDSANGGGGFAPFGMRGIFNGAAIVYFSYIGYDAVSTTAEEVKNPTKNMTIGLSGSVIAVTILYCFIALALCMLQPYNLVSRRNPPSQAAAGALHTGIIIMLPLCSTLPLFVCL